MHSFHVLKWSSSLLQFDQRQTSIKYLHSFNWNWSSTISPYSHTYITLHSGECIRTMGKCMQNFVFGWRTFRQTEWSAECTGRRVSIVRWSDNQDDSRESQSSAFGRTIVLEKQTTIRFESKCSNQVHSNSAESNRFLFVRDTLEAIVALHSGHSVGERTKKNGFRLFALKQATLPI